MKQKLILDWNFNTNQQIPKGKKQKSNEKKINQEK